MSESFIVLIRLQAVNWGVQSQILPYMSGIITKLGYALIVLVHAKVISDLYNNLDTNYTNTRTILNN